MEDKLNKIIDLLVAQNNLLTSIMLSLKESSSVNTFAPSAPLAADNLQDQVKQKIARARAEAQAKLSKVSVLNPEISNLLKHE